MSLKRQIGFWIAALAFFVAFLYVFSSVLLPFVAGMALAYFLDPVADRLERLGLSRMWATVAILVAFVLVFVLSLLIVIPALVHQFAGFMERFPDYVARLQDLVGRLAEGRIGQLFNASQDQLKENLGNFVSQGAKWAGGILSSLWSGGQALADVLSLFVVTPVVAFYLLYDWDRMIAKVDSWLPRDHAPTVRRLATEINVTLADFVRGQGSMCLVLGIYYAAALTLAGLNFGLLIGLVVGLISFIPYVGATIGLIASVGVALVQFWPDWLWIGLIAGIFFFGQFLEGYVLQPKLVGHSIGLHPVVLMFALFAFGALFGFVGMLIAVPTTAALRVLAKFGLDQYLKSPLYRGTGRADGGDAAASGE